MYFEGAKKQNRNYDENVVLQMFFSSFAKIYTTAILTNCFRCIRSKSQWSTHPVVFFNPLMLVDTMTYILKQIWKS